jgi:hypothetical protein
MNEVTIQVQDVSKILNTECDSNEKYSSIDGIMLLRCYSASMSALQVIADHWIAG